MNMLENEVCQNPFENWEELYVNFDAIDEGGIILDFSGMHLGRMPILMSMVGLEPSPSVGWIDIAQRLVDLLRNQLGQSFERVTAVEIKDNTYALIIKIKDYSADKFEDNEIADHAKRSFREAGIDVE